MSRDSALAVLTDRTLVLNVTYQPLSIVSVRRALLLVIADKAETLHEREGVVRSERLQMAAPSVVRLRYHVSTPYRRRAPLHRRAVFARDGHECQYCGRAAECIDHVHPRSKGGPHSWENVVACCRSCNVAKGDTLPDESRFRLPSRPYAPEPLAVAAAIKGRTPDEWGTYLPALLPMTA